MKRCLNENEITQCTDCLAEIGGEELPDDIKNHLEGCEECKDAVLEVGEMII
jgi:NAD-dependent SIR2 family protein deacetylase